MTLDTRGRAQDKKLPLASLDGIRLSLALRVSARRRSGGGGTWDWVGGGHRAGDGRQLRQSVGAPPAHAALNACHVCVEVLVEVEALEQDTRDNEDNDPIGQNRTPLLLELDTPSLQGYRVWV